MAKSLIDAFAFAAERGYDWVITIDCDHQHEPARIPAFVAEAAREDADVISGSRYLQPGPDDDHAPPDRRRINQTINSMFDQTLGAAADGLVLRVQGATAWLRSVACRWMSPVMPFRSSFGYSVFAPDCGFASFRFGGSTVIRVASSAGRSTTRPRGSSTTWRSSSASCDANHWCP